MEAAREEVLERLRRLNEEFDAIVSASEGANSDDEHDPEGATIAFERERTAALRAQAEAHLRDIDEALARVAEGTYGCCRGCGGPIGEERLGALPGTPLCATCAAYRFTLPPA